MSDKPDDEPKRPKDTPQETEQPSEAVATKVHEETSRRDQDDARRSEERRREETTREVTDKSKVDLVNTQDGPEGTKLQTFAEGPNKDKLAAVERGDGATREFKYGADGSLNSIKNFDGSKFVKDDQGNWTRQSKDGKTTIPLDGPPSVDDKGNISYKDAKSGARITEFANRTEARFDNGLKVTEYNRNDPNAQDKHLARTIESADGKYKRSEYEGRQDGVTAVSEYKGRQDRLEKYTQKADGTAEFQYKNNIVQEKYGPDTPDKTLANDAQLTSQQVQEMRRVLDALKSGEQAKPPEKKGEGKEAEQGLRGLLQEADDKRLRDNGEGGSDRPPPTYLASLDRRGQQGVVSDVPTGSDVPLRDASAAARQGQAGPEGIADLNVTRGRDGKIEGNLKVGKDGTLTYENQDGKQIRRPNGQVETYDKKGELTGLSVRGQDGERMNLTRTADGKWQQKDAQGQAVKQGDLDGLDVKRDRDGKIEGSFKVDKDGTVTYENKDGRQVHRPDGRVEKYDRNGQLTEMSVRGADGERTTVTRGKDGKWEQKDAEGKRITDGKFDGFDVKRDADGKIEGDFKVGKDGTVSYENKDGKQIHRQDGHQETYDKNGKLTELTLPDGTTLSRTADGKWQQRDREGSPTRDGQPDGFDVKRDREGKIEGDFKVGKDGTITYENQDGKQVRRTNGQMESYDSNGDLRQLKLPNGDRLTWKGPGQWEHTEANGNKVRSGMPGGFEVNRDARERTIQGDFKVDQDGNVTYESQNGKQVRHLDGRIDSFDKKGDLTGISFPDKTRLEKDAEGKWHQTKEGKPSADKIPGFDLKPNERGEIEGDFKAGKDGSLTFQNKDGSQTLRQDGRLEKYDKGGNLTDVKFPDGTQLHRDAASGKWQQTRDGKPSSDNIPGFNAKANDKGEIEGNLKVGQDGSLTLENKNGSQTLRQDGRLETYNKKGELTALKLPDGTQLQKDAGGKWKQTKDGSLSSDSIPGFDAKPNEKGEIDGDFKVGADGSLTLKNKDGSQTLRPDGRVETYDKSGQLTQVKFPDGHQLQKDASGKWQQTRDGKPSTDAVPGFEGVKPNARGEIEGDFKAGKDGSLTFQNKDGSQVLRQDGRLESYNKDGKLTGLKFPDGTQLHRDAASGKWRQTKDGQRATDNVPGFDLKPNERGEIEGDFKVGKDGSLTFQNNEGAQTLRQDGRLEKYDKNGQLTSLRMPDGTQLEKGADGKWKQTKDGNLASDKLPGFDAKPNERGEIEGDFKVGKDGSLTLQNKDGSCQTVRPDGRVETYNKNQQLTDIKFPDGHQLHKDANTGKWLHTKDGKPSSDSMPGFDLKHKANGEVDGNFKAGADGSISYQHKDGSQTLRPDGRLETYNKKGELTQVDFPDGNQLKRQPDGKWKQTKDGQPSSDAIPGTDIKPDEKGEFEGKFKAGKDGAITYEHKDGFQTIRPDGRIESYDKQGQLTDIKFPDGNHLHKDATTGKWTQTKDGKPSSDSIPGFDLKPNEKGEVEGNFKAGKDGSITHEGKDGSKTLRPDGRLETYDKKGELTQLNFPDGTQLKKGADGKWEQTKNGQPSKDAIPGFELNRDNQGKIEGNLRVNKNGDIIYDNGRNVRQILRQDGSKERYDYNKYERTIEKDGEKKTTYWDGYNWREAAKDQNGRDLVHTDPRTGVTTVQFKPDPNNPNAPVKMERDGNNDKLKVTFQDGSSYDASWKEQKQVYDNGRGQKTTYYNDGRDNWREAQAVGTDPRTGETVVRFKPDGKADSPEFARINKDKKEITSVYKNGSEVTRNADGHVSKVKQANGKTFEFERNAAGEITKVKLPDGSVLEREGKTPAQAAESRGEAKPAALGQPAGEGKGAKPGDTPGEGKGPGTQTDVKPGEVRPPSQPTETRGEAKPEPKKAAETDRWVLKREGQPPQTFDGTFDVKDNGTITLTKPNGQVTATELNGRSITRDGQGSVVQIVESNGNTWNAKPVQGKPGEYEFTLAGNDKVKFQGKEKLNEDGTVKFETGDGVLQRHRDGSTSKFDNTGETRTWENGAYMKKDTQGRITETKDADGNKREYKWSAQKDANGNYQLEKIKVTDSQNRTTELKGVEQAGDKKIVRQVGPDGTFSEFKIDKDGKTEGGSHKKLDGSDFTTDKDGRLEKGTFRNPDKSVTVVEKDSVTTKFEDGSFVKAARDDGRLLQTKDVYGNTRDFHYRKDSQNRNQLDKVTVTDASERQRVSDQAVPDPRNPSQKVLREVGADGQPGARSYYLQDGTRVSQVSPQVAGTADGGFKHEFINGRQVISTPEGRIISDRNQHLEKQASDARIKEIRQSWEKTDDQRPLGEKVDDARSVFLDRYASDKDRTDAIAHLNKLANTPEGQADASLAKTIGTLQAFNQGMDILKASGQGGTPEKTKEALQSLDRLAKGPPANQTAADLVNALGGQQGTQQLLQQLNSTDANVRAQAMASIEQKLAPALESQMNAQRLDLLTKGLGPHSSPEALAKAEAGLRLEVAAGNNGARDWAQWASAATALSQLSTARSGEGDGSAAAQRAIDSLVVQSAGGNKHAHAALSAILAASGDPKQGAEFNRLQAGENRDAKVLTAPRLDGLSNEDRQAVLMKAADQLQREVLASGGKLSQSDAAALTGALAHAHNTNNAALRDRLSGTLDAALAGPNKDVAVAALAKAMQEKIPGAENLAGPYLRHATPAQLAQDFPKFSQLAGQGEKAALAVLSGIAAGQSADKNLAQQAHNIVRTQAAIRQPSQTADQEPPVRLKRRGQEVLGPPTPRDPDAPLVLSRTGIRQADRAGELYREAGNEQPRGDRALFSPGQAQAGPDTRTTLERAKEVFGDKPPALPPESFRAGTPPTQQDKVNTLARDFYRAQSDADRQKAMDGLVREHLAGNPGAAEAVKQLSAVQAAVDLKAADSAGNKEARQEALNRLAAMTGNGEAGKVLENYAQGKDAKGDSLNLTRREITERHEAVNVARDYARDGMTEQQARELLKNPEALTAQILSRGDAPASLRQEMRAALDSSDPAQRQAARHGLTTLVGAGKLGPEELRAVQGHMTPEMTRALQQVPKEVLDKPQEALGGQSLRQELMKGLDATLKDQNVKGVERERAIEAMAALGSMDALKKPEYGLKFDTPAYGQGKVTNVTDRDGTKFEFNRVGDQERLRLVSDRPDGTWYKNEADNAGKFAGTFESDGKNTYTTRDANGNITQVTKPDGSWLKVDYKDGKPTRLTESGGAQWESQDGRTWQNKFSGEQVTGQLKVNGNGSYEIKGDQRAFARNNDGSVTALDAQTKTTTQTFQDGSSVVRNEQNQIVKTTDKAGDSREYSYGQDGKLNGIKDKSGEWQLKNGVWENKTTGEKWNGEKSVGTDGSLREKKEGEKHENVHRLDGSRFTYDERGNLTETRAANGQVNKYEYNDQNQLLAVDYGTGKWKTQDGTNWTNEKTGKTWRGTVEVDKNTGIYTEKAASGNYTSTMNPDGSQLWKDRNGDVTKITDARGDTYKFTYEAAGKLSKVEYPDGSVAEKKGDHWGKTVKTDKEGMPGWHRYDSIGVDKDGKLVEKSATGMTTERGVDGTKVTLDNRGRVRERETADRTATRNYFESLSGNLAERSIRNPDGSVTKFDTQGRIAEVTTKTGETRKFERDEQGNIKRITESSGVEWVRSADGKHYELKGTGQKIPVKDVTVERDGTYKFKLAENHEMRRNSDGTVSMVDEKGKERMRTNQDGSRILYDEQGRIAATVDARGRQREYAYGPDGKMNKFKDADGSVWENKEGNKWQKVGSRDSFAGEVKVGADGSHTVKNSRGESVMAKLDGSQVRLDAQDRVTSVKDADGKERKFEYKGNETTPSKVREPDGTVWTTHNGTVWNKQGTKENWNGTITVDKDGNVKEKWASGKEVTKRTDGWREIKENGATRLEHKDEHGATVVKNQLGQITEVRDAKGQSRKFEYDTEGHMVKMSDASGTWKTTDGQNWTKEGTNETWKGKREVAADGRYREVADGGEQTVFKTDGSKLNIDEAGRVTQVTLPNNQTMSFKYDDNKLVEMKDTAGGVWKSTDGQSWKKEGSNETFNGTIQVRPDGSVERKDTTSGERTILGTDGRKNTFDRDGKILRAEGADGQVTTYKWEAGKIAEVQISNKDGTKLNLDAQGRITYTRDVNGKERHFKYEGNRLAEVKEASGKVWKTKDGVNWTSDKGEQWRGRLTVGADGSYSWQKDGRNETVTHQLDGNTKYANPPHGHRLENSKGQIIETVDAKGNKRTYGYNEDGQIVRATEGNSVWETKDGHNWTRQGDGKTWQGRIRLEKDGTYVERGTGGSLRVAKPDGSDKTYSYQDMKEKADKIETAFNGGWTGAGTDHDTAKSILEGASYHERQEIIAIWNRDHGTKYRHTFAEEIRDEYDEGAQRQEMLALMTKPDGADNAATIHVALAERAQWFEGRSNSELEKVVRNTLETMTHDEIQQTDQQYRQRFGKSLRQAIEDSKLSEETKAAARIYLKGSDQRTDADRWALINNAINAGNLDMFAEATRRLPENMRNELQSDAWQNKIKNTFDHWYSSRELRHAQSYAEFGKLSGIETVRDNTSWMGDNEQAIETGLRDLNQRERDLYKQGMTGEGGERAQRYYREMQERFQAAGNATEQQRWEDMVLHPGGSLVSKLAEHRGSFYDDHVGKVIETVENMSQQDWNLLKNEPGYRDRVQNMLNTYLSKEEADRVMAVVDRKAAAKTFEESKEQRRSVMDAIDDARGWNNDEERIYKAVENMTSAERKLYAEGKKEGASAEARQFAERLEQKLRDSLDSSEEAVAFGLLKQVEQNPDKPARMDIMDKLRLHASYFDADERQVVNDIEQAFKDDPGLRERINNPKTEADRVFAAEFKETARKAMGSSDYKRYAKPLIETGYLSVERRMELNRGVFDDDEQASYKDAAGASAAERQRLVYDKAFQNLVFSHLSDNERQIAIYAAQQGEMRAEDKLRSYMVGPGTSEQEIKDLFKDVRNPDNYKDVPPNQVNDRIKERLDEIRSEYKRKYGADLDLDLLSELGGKDLRQVQRDAHMRDSREEFLFAQQDASTTRSGFGSWLTDKVWDGTGYQLDSDVHQLARTMVEQPEEVRQLAENLYKAIDMHAESKEAMADAIVDVTLTGAAIAAAPFTGGVSLSYLVYASAAAATLGAAYKIGVKSAIMGGDYSGGQALVDGLSGAADAGTALIGGGFLKAGRSAGVKAAEETLEAGGKALLKEGAEQTLKREAGELVAKAIAQRAEGISDDAIKALAKSVAKDGQEEAVANMLKQALEKNIKQEAGRWLKHTVIEMTENAAVGFGAGGFSGAVRAGFQAQNAEQFAQMTLASAGFGAMGGAGFTAAMKVPVVEKTFGAAMEKYVNTVNRILGRGGLPEGQLARAAHEAVPDATGAKPDAPAPKVDAPTPKPDASPAPVERLNVDKPAAPVVDAPAPPPAIAKSGQISEAATNHAKQLKEAFNDPEVKGVILQSRGDTSLGRNYQGAHVADQIQSLAKGNPPLTHVGVELDPRMQGHVNDYLSNKISASELRSRLNLSDKDNQLIHVLDAVKQHNTAHPDKQITVATVGDRGASSFEAGENWAKLKEAAEQSNGKFAILSSATDGEISLRKLQLGADARVSKVPDAADLGHLRSRVDPPHPLDRSQIPANPQHAPDAFNDALQWVDPKLRQKLLDEPMTLAHLGGNAAEGANRIPLANASDARVHVDRLRDIVDNPAKFQVDVEGRTVAHELVGHRAFDDYLSKHMTPAELKVKADLDARLAEINKQTFKDPHNKELLDRYWNSPQELAAERVAVEAQLISKQRAMRQGQGDTTALNQEFKQLLEYRTKLQDAIQAKQKAEPETASYFKHLDNFMQQTFGRHRIPDVSAPGTALPKAARLEVGDDASRIYKPEIPPPSEAELAALNKQIPELNKAAAEDFSARMAKVRDGWTEDFTPAVKRQQELAPEVKNAHQKLEQEVASLKRRGAKDAEIEAAKLDKDHPLNRQTDLYKAHQQWKQLADEHAALTRQLDDVARARHTQLQEAVDQFTKDNGLPPVKLEVAEHTHAAGTYTFGQGTITIPKSQLTSAGGQSGLNKNVFHELVHLQQDQTLVRASIQSTQVPGKPMDVDAVRQHYKAATGRDLDPEFLKQVADASLGKPPLTADDLARVTEIADAVKNAKPVASESADLLNSARVTASKIDDLRNNADGQAANRLLKELLDEPGGENLARRLFGDGPIPDEVKQLARKWDSLPKDPQTGLRVGFNEQDAQQVLNKHLTKRLDDVNAQHKALVDAYAGTRLEKEAYGLDSQVTEPAARVAADAPPPHGRPPGDGGTPPPDGPHPQAAEFIKTTKEAEFEEFYFAAAEAANGQPPPNKAMVASVRERLLKELSQGDVKNLGELSELAQAYRLDTTPEVKTAIQERVLKEIASGANVLKDYGEVGALLRASGMKAAEIKEALTKRVIDEIKNNPKLFAEDKVILENLPHMQRDLQLGQDGSIKKALAERMRQELQSGSPESFAAMKQAVRDLGIDKDKTLMSNLQDAVYKRVQSDLNNNPTPERLAELKDLSKALNDTRGQNATDYYKMHGKAYEGEFKKGVLLSQDNLQDLGRIAELRQRYGQAPISEQEFEQQLLRPFGYELGKGTTHRKPIVAADGSPVRYTPKGSTIPEEPAVSIQRQGIKQPYQRNWLDAVEQLTVEGKRLPPGQQPHAGGGRKGGTVERLDDQAPEGGKGQGDQPTGNARGRFGLPRDAATPQQQVVSKLHVGGQDIEIAPGGPEVAIGRLHQRDIGNLNVSRNHAYIGRDADGSYYIRPHEGASRPTYIKRPGDADFHPVTGKEKIGPDDQIMLSSKNPREGTELKVFKSAAPEAKDVVPAPAYTDKMKALEPDFPNQRRVEINGERYELTRMPGDSWFYGKFPDSGEVAAAKVHVTTNGPADLGRVQAAVIPALKNDPELAQMVIGWKTFDTDLGVGKPTSSKPPTGEGQNAKAFTIYARTPEDAVKIQQKLDKVLADQGLGLERPIATGNVDVIKGTSNRVGIVRDHFLPAVAPDGWPAVRIDQALSDHIHARMGARPGERLNDAQLRQVEATAGIRKGSLSYDNNGDLVLQTYSHHSKLNTNEGKPAVYLDESRADKRPGQLTDRPAFYALSKTYLPEGRDPVDLMLGKVPKPAGLEAAAKPGALLRQAAPDADGFRLGGQKFEITPGGPEMQVGRLHQQSLADPASPDFNRNVSRNHALIGKSADGSYYIQDQGSTYGTYLKRAGEKEFRQIPPGERVALSPGDQVMLGGTGQADVRGSHFQTDPRYRKGTQIVIEERPPGPGPRPGDGPPGGDRPPPGGDKAPQAADAPVRPRADGADQPAVQLKPGDRPPVRPGELDQAQKVMQQGELRLDGGRQGGGNSGHEMYIGHIRQPDGSFKEVIVHNMGWREQSASRFRKEQAAYHINQMLGFDNGFPATAARDVVIDGKATKAWVQERINGGIFEYEARGLAAKRYGGRGSSDDVSRLVREDPQVRKQVEQAFVERLIYGDGDNHAKNFMVKRDGDKLRVQNIDLDYGFPPDKIPHWESHAMQGVNQRLHLDFSEKPLSPEIRQKVQEFVDRYDSAQGRADLARLGLKPDEVEGVLGRARWLAEQGHFPRARTVEEIMQELAQRKPGQ